MNLEARRLTLNQVLSRTRRKKGEKTPRFIFGLPRTERSRRTIDFPSFVVSVLRNHQSQVQETKALAGDRWQENGWYFLPRTARPRMNGTCCGDSRRSARRAPCRSCGLRPQAHACLAAHQRGRASETNIGVPRPLLNQTDDGYVRSSVRRE